MRIAVEEPDDEDLPERGDREPVDRTVEVEARETLLD